MLKDFNAKVIHAQCEGFREYHEQMRKENFSLSTQRKPLLTVFDHIWAKFKVKDFSQKSKKKEWPYVNVLRNFLFRFSLCNLTLNNHCCRRRNLPVSDYFSSLLGA